MSTHFDLTQRRLPRMSSSGRLAAFGVVFALGLSACGSSDSASPAAENLTPVSGGNLISGQDELPSCLDLVQSSPAQNATRQILDTLTDLDTETGEIKPYLATSWQIEDNGRRYLFHLRDGVTFSDGTAFDAQAVKANFDNVIALGKAGKASRGLSYLTNYTGTEVLDPSTVAVTFSEPRAGFLEATAEKELGFLSTSTLAATPQERCQGKLVGTGPFVISEVVPDQKIVLTKRADYNWPTPNAKHSGPAYLDSITFTLIKEDGVRVSSLVSGTVDSIVEVPNTGIDQIKAAGGSIVARTVAGVPRSLAPNLKSPTLADPTVRQAIQKGIDRQEIADTFFTEYDGPASSILTTTVPGYVDLSSSLALDTEGAKALLDGDGWTVGSDGIRKKDGTRLTLGILYTDASYQGIYELVQQQLKVIGIDVSLENITSAEQTERVKNGTFDLVQTSNTRPDPDILLSNFSSQYSSRWAAFPQKELDDLLAQQSREIDPAKRQELVTRVQKLIIDQGYTFPYWNYAEVLAVSSAVHGLWQSVPSAPVYYDTWLSS